MDFLRKLGNLVYQIFKVKDKTYRFEDALFHDDSLAEFLAERPQEAEMIVVGMMFTIEGPDGQDITPDDIAEVLEYRDHEYFASLPRYTVQNFFPLLSIFEALPNNPYKKWARKLQLKEERKAKGHPEEPDPEFDAIKAQLQKDLQAVWEEPDPKFNAIEA